MTQSDLPPSNPELINSLLFWVLPCLNQLQTKTINAFIAFRRIILSCGFQWKPAPDTPNTQTSLTPYIGGCSSNMRTTVNDNDWKCPRDQSIQHNMSRGKTGWITVGKSVGSTWLDTWGVDWRERESKRERGQHEREREHERAWVSERARERAWVGAREWVHVPLLLHLFTVAEAPAGLLLVKI